MLVVYDHTVAEDVFLDVRHGDRFREVPDNVVDARTQTEGAAGVGSSSAPVAESGMAENPSN
jgi:hypothetical protein